MRHKCADCGAEYDDLQEYAVEQARQDERRWLAEWLEKNNTADAMNKLFESLNEDGFEIVVDAEWLCVGEKIWQPFLVALKEGRRL